METLFQPLPTSPARTKVVGAADAVQLIRNGDCVAIGGFGGIGFAEALTLALEQRFIDTGSPRDLTLVVGACPGDLKGRGIDRLAHEGLIKRVISGHWGFAPKLQGLAVMNRIEAYNLPLGCIAQLFRDIAAGRPGLISRVGLGTFVDPRHDGGKVNERTTEDLVELITIKGQEYLFYNAFPLNIALLRGTTADPEGNVTMEREALILEALATASAVHNSGGLAIVQVERLAEAGSLRSREVMIPGALVDCVLLAPPEHHCQTMGIHYSPAFSGEIRVPLRSIPPLALTDRKVIARRAAFELKPNSVVNLGVGMPEGIASVANEEHVLKYLTLTAEPGVIGGMPAIGLLNFGAAVNAQAIIDQPAQFDFYDGGGLDAAFLGMAQVDREGNVNVSRFGPRLPGAGGFINISQNAKRLIFVGTFTAQGQSSVQDDRPVTKNDGAQPKFVHQVDQRTFSGPVAAASGRSVLYVTERCVFRLVPEGLELCEIAPGVDLERDVLAFMGFKPIMQGEPKLMDARIFRPWLMGLKDHLLALPMSARFNYDRDRKLFFVNLEGLVLSTGADLEGLRTEMVTRLEAIGERVHVIANYDHFLIVPSLVDAYIDGLREIAERYYERVSRYSTSSFMRLSLGEALQRRGLGLHIFENWEEIVGRIRAPEAGEARA